MTYGWIWIGVIALAIIIEVVTRALVPIWLIPGALVATILDLCHAKIWWQAVAFLLISSAAIIFSKAVLPKIKPASAQANLDNIVGERCVVTEKIDNYAGCGQVKVKGQVWSARGAFEDDVFEAGEVLHIVAMEGVKLICRK